MWAQSWENIYDLVAPYPDAPNPLDEVDEQLVMQVICQCQKHCTNCEASLCFLKVHIGAPPSITHCLLPLLETDAQATDVKRRPSAEQIAGVMFLRYSTARSKFGSEGRCINRKSSCD